MDVHRYLRDVLMLILDQPTISLAARGRHEIVKQILHLADERTVVLVSHRGSGVPAELFQLQAEVYHDGPF